VVKAIKKELSEEEKKKEQLMKSLIELGHSQSVSKQALENSSSLPDALAKIKLL